MTNSTFVGRESELTLLMQILMDGSANHGRVIFLEGEAGTGKSFLVQALQEQARQLSGADKMQFVYGYCYEDTGEQNAYHPFAETLGSLLTTSRAHGNLSEMILAIVKETASDWLNLIPGVGPVASAVVKTAVTVREIMLGGQDKFAGQSESLSTQYVQTIAKIAPRFAPLVLVIEDAHWIDDASCRLLLRLAMKIEVQPVLIIVTYRPSYLTEGHPLRKTRNELLVKNLVKAMPLSGLNEKEIETYLVYRFGNPLNPRLATWLMYLCKGHPLFVTQYLSLLEEDGIIHPANRGYALDGEIKYVASEWKLKGRLTTAPVPTTMEALLKERIERLVEEDREMLQLGAVQGEYFMSFVLAGLLKKDELDVLRRLRRVVKQHRLISLYTGEDVDKTDSEVYVFEHTLLQQAFYQEYLPHERTLYHHSIAELLERMSRGQNQPSRKLILEIARHYDLGEVPESAASYYQLAAQSLLADGANVEAAEISKRALRNIRQVANADHQRAEILELLLVATEWHRSWDEASQLTARALVDEAEVCAARSGDKALLARIKFSSGWQIGRTGNLSQRLTKFREALDLVRQTNDPVSEFFIMSQLGHEIRNEDPEAGFALQQEAYRLFQDRIAAPQAQISPQLKRLLFGMQNLLGIAEFDRGNYDEALLLLEAASAGFRQIRLKDELAASLNYLAQVYMAIGLFEQAETALKEALAVMKDDESPHIWGAYNLSLLGKVYLEWERPRMAVGPLRQGWRESQATASMAVLPLIRNYYAELLMHPSRVAYDLTEADHLLAANVEDSIANGYHRSAIAALSLRSLVALTQNQIDAAVDYSTQAVTYLQKMGAPPALRKEEVLFNHYRVMKAADHAQEAQIYLEQAYAVLRKKAESIKEDNYRKLFLESVPLSRAIIAAIGIMP